jgi:hypothetical protein
LVQVNACLKQAHQVKLLIGGSNFLELQNNEAFFLG